MAGLLVQLVDVLGDQRQQLAAPLQRQQGAVASVGLGLPHGAGQPAAPGRLAHLRVGQVGLQGRLLLGCRLGGPHPLRAAEIGDARIGGDAGPGEHHDAPGLGHPGLDSRKQVSVGHGPSPVGFSRLSL